MRYGKIFIDEILETIRPHVTTWMAEAIPKGLILGKAEIVHAVMEASRTIAMRAANEEAPEKHHRVNFDQVLTRAIAEGAPAYDLRIGGDPIADYIPEGREIVIRHRGFDAHLEGVVAWTSYPVTYRSRGTVRFLTSLQTETTDEGNRAQLNRLERGHRG